MKIENGEIIKLSNDKEYICFSTVSDQGIDYVYLMSNFKPVEIKFARQSVVDGELKVSIVNNTEEKQKVLKLFQEINK